jgi:putative membrane protein
LKDFKTLEPQNFRTLAGWKKNDRRAILIIGIFSLVVVILISVLARTKLDVQLGFDPHVFAKLNAIINSIVAVLLISGLIAVKSKRFFLHKRIMLTSMVLSVIFLISYILHHLFAGEARFGDVDHNGTLSESEKAAAGSARYIYYLILGTHIPLAGIALPIILFTAYRALSGDFDKHKKWVRVTWPLWFYVAVTGVVVYFMIKPYY